MRSDEESLRRKRKKKKSKKKIGKTFEMRNGVFVSLQRQTKQTEFAHQLENKCGQVREEKQANCIFSKKITFPTKECVSERV